MSERTLIACWIGVALLFPLGFNLIYDTDIFWQIRLGQIMLDEGRIPMRDRFTYTRFGEPVPPIYWLAQGLYALAYGLGGWHLTRAIHHLALVGSLCLSAMTSRRYATSPMSLIIAMTVGFIAMLPNSDLRPQSFGLFGFAALLALARGTLSLGVKLVIAAPLLVAWQNMHPSVPVGVVALVGLVAADLREYRLGKATPWVSGALLLLAVAAQLATPLGVGVFDVSSTNLRISRDVLDVPEWLPPWDPIVAGAAVSFWIIMIPSTIAVSWLGDRLSLRDRALFVVMTLLALYAARFILFWAVALVPLWAEIVELLTPSSLFTWARGHGERRVVVGRASIGLAIGLVLVLALHPVRLGPIFRHEIPLEGVRVLRARLPDSARIYNSYPWAGPLILEGARGWRLAVDGRLFAFPDPAEWRAILDADAGEIPLEELERRHRPDAFFLSRSHAGGLIERLSSCPRWRLCYCSPSCAAFIGAR